MPLGERLKQARLTNGLTLRGAAERAGVDSSAMWRYEAGNVEPSALALRGLAAIYGVSVDWLMGKDDDGSSVSGAGQAMQVVDDATPPTPAMRAITAEEAVRNFQLILDEPLRAPKLGMSSLTVDDVEGGRSVGRAARQVALKVFGARLQVGRGVTSLTQEDVAEALIVATQTVRNWEAGRTEPSRGDKERLAALYGKSVEWFIREGDEAEQRLTTEESEAATRSTSDPPSAIGTLDDIVRELGERFDRLESAIRAPGIAEPRVEYDASDDVVDRDPVDVNELAAAAGGGADVYDETVVGRIWFRRDWLQRHAIDPKQCNVITVRGQSMEPTLPQGCSILVDRSQGRRRRHPGRIYVMRTEDGLVVKRVAKDKEGQWQIASDNPGWEDVPWSGDMQIIGEVRWAARTF